MINTKTRLVILFRTYIQESTGDCSKLCVITWIVFSFSYMLLKKLLSFFHPFRNLQDIKENQISLCDKRCHIIIRTITWHIVASKWVILSGMLHHSQLPLRRIYIHLINSWKYHGLIKNKLHGSKSDIIFFMFYAWIIYIQGFKKNWYGKTDIIS